MTNRGASDAAILSWLRIAHEAGIARLRRGLGTVAGRRLLGLLRASERDLVALYLRSQDVSLPRPLVELGGEYVLVGSSALASANGRYVALLIVRKGAGASKLYLADTRMGVVRNVVSGALGARLTFSRDSRYVMFERQRPVSHGSGRMTIEMSTSVWAAKCDGGASSLLMSGEAVAPVAGTVGALDVR